MIGKVIGIGAGPGDPELLTLKAVKTLKRVDVVFVPQAEADKSSIALQTVKPILDKRESPPEIHNLVFPMTKNQKKLKKAWTKNADIVTEKAKEGKIVAFITVGDPMFYSTFIYLHKLIKMKSPEVKFEVIPGVTALTACSASSRVPVAESDEVVAIVPSQLDLVQMEAMAKHSDNLVFMKETPSLKVLASILEKSGFTEESTIASVRRCAMPEEEVMIGKLREAKRWDTEKDYFIMTLIKKSEILRDFGKERV